MKTYTKKLITTLLNCESKKYSPADKLDFILLLLKEGCLDEPNEEGYEEDGNGD